MPTKPYCHSIASFFGRNVCKLRYLCLGNLVKAYGTFKTFLIFSYTLKRRGTFMPLARCCVPHIIFPLMDNSALHRRVNWTYLVPFFISILSWHSSVLFIRTPLNNIEVNYQWVFTWLNVLYTRRVLKLLIVIRINHEM